MGKKRKQPFQNKRNVTLVDASQSFHILNTQQLPTSLSSARMGSRDIKDTREVEKLFYQGFCTAEEIERIFDIRNAQDYLLKIRASAVVDKTRLYRVMLSRRRRAPNNWKFEDHFDSAPFNDYISGLSDTERHVCSTIPAGFVFSDDPNGACIRTRHGNIIVISESLRYFLYFMNLAFLDFELEVPLEVRLCSLLIGIRTMLQTESMDFDIDPRGKVPAAIDQHIGRVTMNQLRFVIGHEFAHHVLGHMGENSIVQRHIFMNGDDADEAPYDFYAYQRNHEFAADEWAVASPALEPQPRRDMAVGAATFFAILMVHYHALDLLCPNARESPTHPNPADRFDSLVNKTFELCGFEDSGILETVNFYRKFLTEDIAARASEYNVYGSVYLGPWRGPILKDRVDY